MTSTSRTDVADEPSDDHDDTTAIALLVDTTTAGIRQALTATADAFGAVAALTGETGEQPGAVQWSEAAGDDILQHLDAAALALRAASALHFLADLAHAEADEPAAPAEVPAAPATDDSNGHR